MRADTVIVQDRRRGRGRIGAGKPAAPSASNGTAAAPGLALLGQGHGVVLPNLRGVRSRYCCAANGERLYRLCQALVEHKLGDEALWAECGKNASVFVSSILDMGIHSICGDALKDQVDYDCAIQDSWSDAYWKREALPEEQLVITFDIRTCGFLKIGAALAALEAEERFLGAAFYLLVRRSLYRWVRIYDHSDAEFYNEELHEWMAQDDPENRDAYEFPAVEGAIPEPVRTTKELTEPSARRLLRAHLSGPYGMWIQKLFKIHRLSRLRKFAIRFDGEFDSPPVPTLLLVFRENDAIQACFDHESDRYNESDNEPACAVLFRPDNPMQFRAALRTVKIFLQLNRDLFEMVAVLNDWGEKYGRECQNRTELPVRSA